MSVTENVAKSQLVGTVFGTKHYQNITYPFQKELIGTMCWQPNGRKSRNYTTFYSHNNGANNTCVYDAQSLGFCACSNDLGLDSRLLIPVTFTGDIWYDDLINYDRNNKTKGIVTDRSPNVVDPLNNSNYTYTIDAYEMGSEVKIVNAFDPFERDSGSTTVTGNVSTMETHVKVRWYWLILPMLLNLAAAVMWRTSLVAAYFHGLDKDPEIEAAAGRQVSQLDREAEKRNVRLEDEIGEMKMALMKGDWLQRF